MVACGKGDIAVPQELLQAGANPDLTNEVMQLYSHGSVLNYEW